MWQDFSHPLSRHWPLAKLCIHSDSIKRSRLRTVVLSRKESLQCIGTYMKKKKKFSDFGVNARDNSSERGGAKQRRQHLLSNRFIKSNTHRGRSFHRWSLALRQIVRQMARLQSHADTMYACRKIEWFLIACKEEVWLLRFTWQNAILIVGGYLEKFHWLNGNRFDECAMKRNVLLINYFHLVWHFHHYGRRTLRRRKKRQSW